MKKEFKTAEELLEYWRNLGWEIPKFDGWYLELRDEYLTLIKYIPTQREVLKYVEILPIPMPYIFETCNYDFLFELEERANKEFEYEMKDKGIDEIKAKAFELVYVVNDESMLIKVFYGQYPSPKLVKEALKFVLGDEPFSLHNLFYNYYTDLDDGRRFFIRVADE